MKTAARLPQVTTSAGDAVTGTQYQTTNDIFTVSAGLLNVPAALSSITS